MKNEFIKSFVKYYLSSLPEHGPRGKNDTSFGLNRLIYNIGLAKFGKPVRLSSSPKGNAGCSNNKVEAEFDVNLAFLADEAHRLTIFVPKSEPLPASTWTGEHFDRNIQTAVAADLETEGLGQVTTVNIVLAYNKDDQRSGVEACERFEKSAPSTVRKDVALEFTRWNLQDLVDLTIAHLLSPSLLPERFFGQLTYLSQQAADFPHGSDAWEQQLIPNWKGFLDDILDGSTALSAASLIPVALVILRNQADRNPSIETGWVDLIEWAAIALWRLHIRQRSFEIAAAVHRFWRDFYIAELERFYSAHVNALTTEQALDRAASRSHMGTITAAYIAYWHLGRLGILGISGDDFAVGGQRRSSQTEVANWVVRFINASPAVLRPLLDIHHIQIFLTVEVLRRAGRIGDISNLFAALIERLYSRRMGDGEVPFLHGGNSLEDVLEEVATKPAKSFLLTTTSFLVLMILELCFVMPEPERDFMIRAIHSQLVLGTSEAGPLHDRTPLQLVSWIPPDNWSERVFDPGLEGGYSVVVQPFTYRRETSASEVVSGIRRLVSTMREQTSPLQFPTDIPLGAFVLACLRYGKPLPPEIWRSGAFPSERTETKQPDSAPLAKSMAET